MENEFKQAQARLGLKNQQMADLLGVTIQYVEMLRGGRSNASKIVWRVIELAERLKKEEQNGNN